MDQHEWDVDVVKDLFNDRYRHLILSIPLSSSVATNNWFWKKETSGFYSVKSAFKYLKELKGDWVWHLLWKIEVPPKVWHFKWKVLYGCLPTRIHLQTKHVNVELSCLLCCTEEESISHVLIGCSFARSCWHKSLVDPQSLNFIDIKDWFTEFLRRRRLLDVVEEVAMVFWSKWKVQIQGNNSA